MYSYKTVVCRPELLEKTLNSKANEGWKFITLVTQQKVEVVKTLNPAKPMEQRVETFFELIFERKES